jgi:hypothetical protein
MDNSSQSIRCTTGYACFAKCQGQRQFCPRKSLCRGPSSAKRIWQIFDRHIPLYQVLFVGHLVKKSGRDDDRSVNGYFGECPSTWHSAKIFLTKFFAEYSSLSTRQRIFLKKILCECPATWHSAKIFFWKFYAECTATWHSAKQLF